MNLTVLPSKFDSEAVCDGCGFLPQFVVEIGMINRVDPRQAAMLCLECIAGLAEQCSSALVKYSESYVRLPSGHEDVRNALAIPAELAKPRQIPPKKGRRKRKR